MQFILLSFVTLVLIFSAQASPATTLTFDGLIGNAGTFSGQVDYDEVVTGTNMRGLSSNVGYAVSSYSLTVRANESVLPDSLTFTNSPGQSIELCSGQCVFGYQPVNNLIFTEPGYRLQLGFTPDWSTLLAAPSRLQWNPDGKFYDSMLLVRMNQPGPQMASVPEPSTWLFLAIGLIVALGIARAYVKDLA